MECVGHGLVLSTHSRHGRHGQNEAMALNGRRLGSSWPELRSPVRRDLSKRSSLDVNLNTETAKAARARGPLVTRRTRPDGCVFQSASRRLMLWAIIIGLNDSARMAMGGRAPGEACGASPVCLRPYPPGIGPKTDAANRMQ
jgi:hypothetical protein